MLVYATRLWFTPDTQLDTPLAVIARWLSRKAGKQVTAARLLSPTDMSLAGAQRIRSVPAVSDYPKVLSVALIHPDSDVAGRQWSTEVGLRRKQQGHDLECTVLLSTSEISARVSTPVKVSRPGLVTELVRRCSISPATQGVATHTLAHEDVEGFRHVVLDERRRYSLVVLSPDLAGAYLTAPTRLQSLLLGLADLVLIPPGADTFWLAREAGREYVPYRGAIRVIYPGVRAHEGYLVPTRVITPQDARALQERGTSVDDEVLSLVVHRSNLPLSWLHISPQVARDLQLQRALLAKRDQAAKSGDQGEWIRFLEEQVTTLEASLETRDSSIVSLEKLVEAQADAERQLRFDNEALKQHLAEASRATRRDGSDEDDRAALLCAITSALSDGVTPATALLILESLFPERIEVLPDAWQAVRESDGFKHGARLMQLLTSLATDYWEALTAGRPDAEARKVFGNAYAAKESERVASNRGARTRRTFEYRGHQFEMMKHLKIGVKDSAAETIRVHFEWFPEDKKIVIGHCGPHIPFR
ncbi:MAG: hypothetical protein AB7I38_17440 [Dehalococcoidia bacterium]